MNDKRKLAKKDNHLALEMKAPRLLRENILQRFSHIYIVRKK
jgi:hypothetical protein